jgi:hypothetical protein
MATRIYGVSVGEGEFSVVEDVGSAVAADSVELTVDIASTVVTSRNDAGTGTTRSITKVEVLDAIEKIKNHIIKGNWPPA